MASQLGGSGLAASWLSMRRLLARCQGSVQGGSMGHWEVTSGTTDRMEDVKRVARCFGLGRQLLLLQGVTVRGAQRKLALIVYSYSSLA